MSAIDVGLVYGIAAILLAVPTGVVLWLLERKEEVKDDSNQG